MIKDKIIDAYIVACLAIGTVIVMPALLYSGLKKDGWLRD
jgi:hypothetical protein